MGETIFTFIIGAGIGAYHGEHIFPCLTDTHALAKQKAGPAVAKAKEASAPYVKMAQDKATPYVNQAKDKATPYLNMAKERPTKPQLLWAGSKWQSAIVAARDEKLARH